MTFFEIDPCKIRGRSVKARNDVKGMRNARMQNRRGMRNMYFEIMFSVRALVAINCESAIDQNKRGSLRVIT